MNYNRFNGLNTRVVHHSHDMALSLCKFLSIVESSVAIVEIYLQENLSFTPEQAHYKQTSPNNSRSLYILQKVNSRDGYMHRV